MSERGRRGRDVHQQITQRICIPRRRVIKQGDQSFEAWVRYPTTALCRKFLADKNNGTVEERKLVYAWLLRRKRRGWS